MYGIYESMLPTESGGLNDSQFWVEDKQVTAPQKKQVLLVVGSLWDSTGPRRYGNYIVHYRICLFT